jgi:hypothetical protein
MTITTPRFAEWLCKRIGGISTIDHVVTLVRNPIINGETVNLAVTTSSSENTITIAAGGYGYTGGFAQVILTGGMIIHSDLVDISAVQATYIITLEDGT